MRLAARRCCDLCFWDWNPCWRVTWMKGPDDCCWGDGGVDMYLYIYMIYIYTLHTWCGACCPMKSNPTNEISAVTQVAATKVIICIQTQYLKTHPWTTSLHHSFWFFNMFFNKCHSQYRNFSWGPDPNLGFDAQCAWDLDNPTGDSEALFDLPICYTEVWPLDQQQLWKWMLKLNEAPFGHLGGDGFF